MQRFFLTVWCSLLATIAMYAQPCVQIETILVDACTLGGGCPNNAAPTCSCEGKNEMFTFRVGPNDLNLDDLVINWPNNTFQGICQNAQTAQNVVELNATVEACGEIIEPLDGVLPAGAEVLVVTSADMCIEANPFTNLAGTLYILFQCPGNFQGHFANHGTGFRTTTISFGPGCTFTATYDRSLLVTQAGVPGPQDGAAVDFDVNGNATYYNNGCTAPVEEQLVSAGVPPASACQGETITLEGVTIGTFSEIVWSGGNGTFTNPNEAVTEYIPAADEMGFVTLTLTATDCNGSVSDDVDIEILPQPVAEISTPDGNLTCDGVPVTLSLPPGQIGEWINGSISNSINVNQAGLYSVVVTTACGTANASVAVFGGVSPEITLLNEEPITLCANETLVLEIEANESVTWPDGSDELNFEVSQPGTYTVSAENNCGSLDLDIDVLFGGEGPEAEIIIDGPAEVCEAETLTLVAFGNGDYEWSTGSTADEINVGAGTYTLNVTNNCGSETVSITIDAVTPPELTLTSEDALLVCDGEPVEVSATSNGNLLWPDGSTETSFFTATPGAYEVESSNACGTTSTPFSIIDGGNSPVAVIIAEEGLVVCDNAAIPIGLTTGEGLWSTGETANTITVDTPGEYTVEVSNQCGTASDTIELIQGLLPDLALPGGWPEVLCEGEQATLSAESDGLIVWPDGSSGNAYVVNAPGDYLVTAVNDCGSTELIVSIADGGSAPVAEILVDGPSAVCASDSTTLLASGGDTYLWSNSETETSIGVGAGTYTLTAENSCGSSVTEITIDLIEIEPPVVLNEDLIICNNDILVLNAEGDGTIEWEDGSIGQSFVVEAPGTYTVTLTNACGSAETTVTVNASEIDARFVQGSPSDDVPADVLFVNTSTGAMNYLWLVDSTLVAETENLTHEFVLPGSYTVTLIAADAGGCTDMYSLTIEVTMEASLYVPNAFTPDNDGINEVFRAYGQEFDDFRLIIFNRWGDQVFESDDMQRGWNGDSKGSGYYAQNDVYMWVITYTNPRGRREQKSGHVVLIR